jgi:hypothetical protein
MDTEGIHVYNLLHILQTTKPVFSLCFIEAGLTIIVAGCIKMWCQRKYPQKLQSSQQLKDSQLPEHCW